MLKTINSITLLSIFLLMTSCGSLKKKGGAEGGDGFNGSDTSNTPGELKLSGDSDSNSAGGLQSIYFAFDSASLSEQSKTTLKENVEYLKAQATVNVQIEGHCDERGGVQYNLALSEKRAKSIKDFLVALGIKGSRLTVIGYGKERPVSLGHGEEDWAKNRRGNFVVTSL